MNIKKIGYMQLTAAMILAGSSVVTGKFVIASFPVFLASALRYALASLILFLLLYIKEKKIPPLIREDILVLTIQAVTGLFGFSVFLLYGLKFTSALESGIIISTTPAIIGILSYTYLREQLPKNRIAGIILAISGVILINTMGISLQSARGLAPLLGNTLVLGAVIGEGLFAILGKVLTKRLSPLAISAYVTGLAFLMFLPLAIFESLEFSFTTVPLEGWLSIIYYALFVTVLGFYCWYSGVSKVAASTSAVFTSLLPISALILSCLILGETLLPVHLIGISLVLLAIWVSARETTTIPLKLAHLRQRLKT